jgi:ethanolamine ammonia-lyase large subunit
MKRKIFTTARWKTLPVIVFMCLGILSVSSWCGAVAVKDVKPGEDVFAYIQRTKGGFDQTLYRQVIGAANAFKQGDEAIGVAADDEASRENARKLLANTKIKDLQEHLLLDDELGKLVQKTIDPAAYEKIKGWTMGELKTFLLTKPEAEIKAIMLGLNAEVVGCVPKLMSNEELIAIDSKIFNPLPKSQIGAKGYLSARIQPNSPTDNPDEIVWQVFSAFSYAVGDIVIGTNPVDSTEENILNVEKALRDVVVTFKLEDVIPWCVLSHIDIQRSIFDKDPTMCAEFFQSLAGTDEANKVFDVSIDKMFDHARAREGQRYGLYYETGQGADFTNGAAGGVDMVVLESRKYGFAKALKVELEKTRPEGAWTHFNDVAGFIGPEVFRTREQLVRCCLEDICMGKLQGLASGLDVCSTLHMAVSLDDLDWCLDQIMPANPAYLMALPTKNDPMLSYLTTSYQDHVRLREKFNFKINDAMWDFFKRIQIVGADNKYTDHFGDPIWVYYQYMLAKGDKRTKDVIMAEGKQKFDDIHGTWLKTKQRVPLAAGYGANKWDLNPQLDKEIRTLYDDAKKAIWAEFTPEFIKSVPNTVVVKTNVKDREDYIVHPPAGEELSAESVASLEKLRDSWAGKAPDVQIIISDGLNAKSIMRPAHLKPYLDAVRKELKAAGYTVDEKNILVQGGRVRAGYQAGTILFSKADPNQPKAILHLIGERPGTGQDAFSVYITAPKAEKWASKQIDHDITKVACGISEMATKPVDGAKLTVKILQEMAPKKI